MKRQRWSVIRGILAAALTALVSLGVASAPALAD
jgi:hypothetical protein